MTREEALDILWKNRETIFNYKMEQVDEYTSIGLVTRSDEGRQYSLALELINKIYDEKEALEAQLKAKDERTRELEEAQLTRREWYQKGYAEAMKPKTCEGCKFDYDIDNFDSIDGKRLDSFRPNECYMCSRNMQDRYEGEL